MTMKSTAERPSTSLGHSMKPRQLTMMGLGSAIGAGLFLGSGAGVQAAGPAVLISYLVAGTLIILVMWALGEMAAANPNSGAFSVYAEKAMGRTAGATVGWLWWLQLVVVIAAEALGAAGLLFTVWPVIPVWVLSLVFMALFTAINLAGVNNFGEFEFWFAILKVAAILMFLGIGTAITLVAVIALLSALNANLYGASRMIYSLAQREEAPRFLSKLNKARVPMVAVGVSVAFGFIAAVLELLFPEQILPALFQLVGSTCLMVWGSALVSQLILRRKADREGTELPLRMKGFPGLTIFGLVLLALIFAVGFSSPESSRQLVSTIILVAAIAAACKIGAKVTASRQGSEAR